MDKERQDMSTLSYERLRTIATVFAAVLVPIVVAVVGQSYTAAIKEQQSRARFVELAIEILREDPSEEQENPLRQWAVDIVNANSGTQLSDTARTALINSRALPSGGRSSIDPVFPELSVLRAGGEVSISALSNCIDRSNSVSMQLLVYDGQGEWDDEQNPLSDQTWSEHPVLRFDPAKVDGHKYQIDAVVDGTEKCTMVLVMQQSGETIRLEHLDLVSGESFFSMPLRIERNR